MQLVTDPDPSPGTESRGTATRHERKMFPDIILLALAVRMAHLWSIVGTLFPRLAFLFAQSGRHTFWQWTHTILAGDPLGGGSIKFEFEVNLALGAVYGPLILRQGTLLGDWLPPILENLLGLEPEGPSADQSASC